MGQLWEAATPFSSTRMNRSGVGVNKFEAGEAMDSTTTPQAVYVNFTDGKVYLSDANATGDEKFHGFLLKGQNLSINDDAYVALGPGGLSEFTGLTKGDYYYVTDTAGAISATPGTTTVLAGIATETDSMLMLPENQSEFHYHDEFLNRLGNDKGEWVHSIFNGPWSDDNDLADGVVEGETIWLNPSTSDSSIVSGPNGIKYTSLDNQYRISAWFELSTDLADLNFYFGLTSLTNDGFGNRPVWGSSVHGVWFKVDEGTFAVTGHCADGSTENSTSLGVTVSRGQIYSLAIELLASEVRFYIDGVQVGSLDANLPNIATDIEIAYHLEENGSNAGEATVPSKVDIWHHKSNVYDD